MVRTAIVVGTGYFHTVEVSLLRPWKVEKVTTEYHITMAAYVIAEKGRIFCVYV